MPGAVRVLISTRKYDSNILQNISSNRRSTKLISYILNIEHNGLREALLGFYIYLGYLCCSRSSCHKQDKQGKY